MPTTALSRAVASQKIGMAVFQMLHETGNLQGLSSWKPIAILPILLNIFVKLVYNWISPHLFGQQSIDKFGLTPGVRVEDAFVAMEGLLDKALEDELVCSVLRLDLRKAFDWVEHDSLVEALQEAGLEECYIALIV